MDFVTVFRSADENAEEDARAITRALDEAGLTVTLLDDSAPGVPEGAWEVRVPTEESERADHVIAMNPVNTPPDQSHDLDMITVFRSAGTDIESEALTVKGLLDAAGLDVQIVADTRFPNLPQQVQVTRAEAPQARRIIAEALAAGPSAAEEAEAESER